MLIFINDCNYFLRITHSVDIINPAASRKVFPRQLPLNLKGRGAAFRYGRYQYFTIFAASGFFQVSSLTKQKNYRK